MRGTTTRRGFLRTAAAAACAPVLPPLRAQDDDMPQLTLRVTATQGSKVPVDFLALSFTAAALLEPAFFAPENISLVQTLRVLAPHGVLRIAGGSTDVKSIDTRVIDALSNFLQAVHWTCIYGLRADGDVASTALFLAEKLGPRLHSLELTNTADGLAAAHAIQSTNASIPFSIVVPADEVSTLSSDAEQPALRAVSTFYNRASDVSLDATLQPDAQLADDLRALQSSAAAVHAQSSRLAEASLADTSSAHGTFTAALWSAELLLRCMQQGLAGVGMRDAIATQAGKHGLSVIGSGMKFVAPFAGATMLPCALDGASTRAVAYAGRRADGRQIVAILNLEGHPIRVMAPFFETLQVLTAPSLDAHEAHVSTIVSETGSRRTSAGQSFTLPAHLATLIVLR